MRKIPLNISRRAFGFPRNPIRDLENISYEVRKKGIKVIPLNIGSPDISSPRGILKKGSEYISKSSNLEYGPSSGNEELREARSRYYKDKLGLNINSEEILVTAGASEALEFAVYSITDPGDEILTPEPFFPNYHAVCYKYNAKLRNIPTSIKDGFHIRRNNETLKDTYKRISAMVNSNTKAIIWSSPSNPTGAVYSKDELKVLLKVAKDKNLIVIADEVYRLLVFDKGIKCYGELMRAPSVYDVASKTDKKRIICLDSSSKEVSFSGGRIGYLVADPALTSYILRNASVRACPNIIIQKAVREINGVNPRYFLKNQIILKKRRDFVYAALSVMKDIGITLSPEPPEGAFYLSFDLGKGVKAEDFCKWLLTDYPRVGSSKKTVFLTPMQTGNGGFYIDKENGRSQVRLAYVREIEELSEAMNILRKAIPLFKKYSI